MSDDLSSVSSSPSGGEDKKTEEKKALGSAEAAEAHHQEQGEEQEEEEEDKKQDEDEGDEERGGWKRLMGENVVVKTIHAGQGPNPGIDDTLTFDVVGRLLPPQEGLVPDAAAAAVGAQAENGDRDATEPAGDAFLRFTGRKMCMGRADEVPGLELALRYMQQGERALLRCNSRFAWGPMGRRPLSPEERAVPPDADIEFEVHLSAIAKASMSPTKQEQLEAWLFRKERGNEQFRQGDYAKAARNYSAVIKEVDLDVYSAGEAGDAGEEDGRGAGAGESEGEGEGEQVMLEAAVKLLLDCGNNITTCFVKMGDLPKAVDSVMAVLSLAPDNVKALVRAAQLSTKRGDFTEAKMALERALRNDPDNKDAKVEQRRLAETKSRYKERSSKMSKAMAGSLLKEADGQDGSLAGGDSSLDAALETIKSATTAAEEERARAAEECARIVAGWKKDREDQSSKPWVSVALAVAATLVGILLKLWLVSAGILAE